ncbi:hypothetical protein ALI144C_07285 [Actinosynnema sp. ALI-1.44]|nr:hypothetical protein ALI144C_07285 [Actinosynnema sp. ALI-1.44]
MRAGQPWLGVGLGYRQDLHDAIFARSGSIDCLEVISEQYLAAAPAQRERLRVLRERFPVVPHGIELSIGTAGPLDLQYLDDLARLVVAMDAPWCSDHLSFTRAGDLAIGQLTPLVRTREHATAVAVKAAQVQRHVGVPFLLENITYYLDFPAELSEAEFITEVVEQADCGLLLDLTNVFVNSVNHHFDPVEFVAAIPLERVVQLHLAGGQWSGDTLVDTHSAPVPEQVWQLLDHVADRLSSLRCVILERDQEFPDEFDELLADLTRARQTFDLVRGG